MSDNDHEFDEDTLRLMRAYSGGDPRVPGVVDDEVFCEYGPETWALQHFLEIIGKALATIPKEDVARARVSLDEGGCLRISYARVQSGQEVANAVASAYAYAQGRLQVEREEYERLKIKYGQ